jgi:hypothetical protein
MFKRFKNIKFICIVIFVLGGTLHAETTHFFGLSFLNGFQLTEKGYFGMAFPSGSVSSSSQAGSDLTFTPGAGLELETLFFKYHALTVEGAYTSVQQKITKDYQDSSADIKYNFKMLTFFWGYRFAYKYFFTGIGGFTSKALQGVEYVKLPSVNNYYDAEKESMPRDIGMYVDLGTRALVTDHIRLSLSVRYMLGFGKYYSSEGDSFKTNTLTFSPGISYAF